MPSTSTPALIPPSDVSANGVSQRRTASAKQQNSVRSSATPIVTRKAYQAIMQGDGSEVTDKKLRTLAGARAQLWTAVTLLQAAAKAYNPQLDKTLTPDEQAAKAPTYNRLRQLHEAVQKQFVAFPLEVVD